MSDWLCVAEALMTLFARLLHYAVLYIDATFWQALRLTQTDYFSLASNKQLPEYTANHQDITG